MKNSNKEKLIEQVNNQFLAMLRPSVGGSIPDDLADNWHAMRAEDFIARLNESGCSLTDWEETLSIYQEKYRQIQSS